MSGVIPHFNSSMDNHINRKVLYTSPHPVIHPIHPIPRCYIHLWWRSYIFVGKQNWMCVRKCSPTILRALPVKCQRSRLSSQYFRGPPRIYQRTKVSQGSFLFPFHIPIPIFPYIYRRTKVSPRFFPFPEFNIFLFAWCQGCSRFQRCHIFKYLPGNKVVAQRRLKIPKRISSTACWNHYSQLCCRFWAIGKSWEFFLNFKSYSKWFVAILPVIIDVLVLSGWTGLDGWDGIGVGWCTVHHAIVDLINF